MPCSLTGEVADGIDRRTLLKSGLLAAGALAGGGAALAEVVAKPFGGAKGSGKGSGHHPGAHGQAGSQGGRGRAPGPPRPVRPNILVVMVDQLRTPQWFSAAPWALALMPNLAKLRAGGVSFASHYTASNDCTPARAAMLTGLHTHQTGCMITGGSTLDPGFPTWGTMLRELGYRTAWFGKWHLTHGDNLWDSFLDAGALEPYGFSGGTYPSPDGAPGQGWRVDPFIAAQFEQWLAKAPSRQPWCTTVSFVNPHDIAWWYRWSKHTAAEASVPNRVRELPPNFESPSQLMERRKPLLQLALQETARQSFGEVPYEGAGVVDSWLPFMDLYLKLLARVDAHIGQVLEALAQRPHVAANTVVVFTSDHGEYGASHGLRGKGGSAYEEAIRVPLLVKDLRGNAGVVAGQGAGRAGRADARPLTAAPQTIRSGLTSSVDVAPLLLSIATGGNDWRGDSHYAHLAGRHDLARMLADPRAPGRPYVLHATDEVVTEFAIEPYAASAPLHLAAIRTPKGKYAVYSHFTPHTIKPLKKGREKELYDYRAEGGRLEVDNVAGDSHLEARLSAELKRAIKHELREPLPRRLHAAQRRGFEDYAKTATRAALKASARRKKLIERQELEEPSAEGPLADSAHGGGTAPGPGSPGPLQEPGSASPTGASGPSGATGARSRAGVPSATRSAPRPADRRATRRRTA
jgi:arylsulfatase A-like enzyme